MKESTIQWNMAQCLTAALLVGVHAFAQAYQPKDEAVFQMQPQEARRQAAELLRQRFYLRNQSVRGVAFTTERMELQIGEAEVYVFPFKDMPLEVTGSFINIFRVAIDRDGLLHTGGSYRAQAEQLANALHRLKTESAKASDPAAEAAFAEAATRYRAASPKPEFPEEARRLRVQAEAMLREKRFLDAAEFYGEALRAVTWWPEGRFNRALVLGEIKDYDEAAREMKRYLMLVPDAPNVRAAQDKIYEWEALGARK